MTDIIADDSAERSTPPTGDAMHEQDEIGALRRVTEESVLARPTSATVRGELLELIRKDLHGPLGGPDEEFSSGENPIDRYPLGRLAPIGEEIVPEEQDGLDEASSDGIEDSTAEPSAPNQPSLFPSALGFTAIVAGDVDMLTATGSWACYELGEPTREDSAHFGSVWQRRELRGTIELPLAEGTLGPRRLTEAQPEVIVRGRAKRYQGNWLITLFLENAQRVAPGPRKPAKWLFQVELSVTGPAGTLAFLARENRVTGGDSTDRLEQKQLAMTYRRHREYAVGHGTAVRVEGEIDQLGGRVERITTSSIGQYEVPTTAVPDPERHNEDVDLPELNDVELGMRELAELAEDDGPADVLGNVLLPLVTGYQEWIKRQTARINDPDEGLAVYKTEARKAMQAAGRAADRIAAGIDTVLNDRLARKAFGFANRAMYLQRMHTKVAEQRRKNGELGFADAVKAQESSEPKNQPRWRPFQLAFMLLNLPSLADPSHPERAEDADSGLADLLWFPTGGGKTEAYLGLTAFTIAIRRLHGERPEHGGLNAADGIAVLMRYTLRLLTIQQFERAATLLCATEVLRRADLATWGERPMRIGMWVGGRVTPNTTEAAESWVTDARKNRPPRGVGSPHQLSSCPWCGHTIEKGRDIEVHPVYKRTLIVCHEPSCPFSAVGAAMDGLRSDQVGLPVLVVDEEIYRNPPALLIATVDKFAQLPWNGQTSTLFGRSSRWCPWHGYLTEDSNDAKSHPAKGGLPKAWSVENPDQLRPPDLIIQDELHLISGPLGSLVGLYETAVDRLATWEHQRTKRNVRPKVIASTATVRRANPQIQSLFRRKTEVFPPPGLDVDDNFFSRRRKTDDEAGRLYVGICSHGSRIRSTLIRVYVSILGAAQKLHEKYEQNEITDPYMTLVGYFNTLRDLGAMRRLVEDDVSTRLRRAWRRGLANRYDVRPKELTSRLSSEQIRPLLDELGIPFPARKDPKTAKKVSYPLDVLLATSMIAVGVDVPRLGVMVVTNQPKSTAEYIQATSRVGRQHPGIVFTVYNWARPRDLSAYEHFEHLHANMYRHVEALSVTPFADRAIDRGLFGVLVALVRELEMTYNANLSAKTFERNSQLADHVVGHLERRAKDVGGPGDETWVRVHRELVARLDQWDRSRKVSGQRLAYYQTTNAPDVANLLRKPGTASSGWHLNTCLNSLRDVEPAVPLLMRQALDADSPQATPEPPWLPYQPTVEDTDGEVREGDTA